METLVEATSLWIGEKELMTVVEVSVICVHMDPAPLELRQSPRSICAREGGTTAHTTPEAHGSATENMYNYDGGFPLKIIIQQLQEEAKHLSVLP